MLSRRVIIWIAATVLVLLVAAAVGMQVGVVRAHPIAQGSTSSSLGLTGGECEHFDPTYATPRCVQVTYSANAPVGVGFSVRNTGRFPLTIESVESFGTESDNMLAEMHAVLPPEGELFSVNETRPFEPIHLGPGEEATIQMMGHTRDCRTAWRHWGPGSGTGLDRVRLRVRWLLMSTTVEIPLQQELRIITAKNGECQ